MASQSAQNAKRARELQKTMDAQQKRLQSVTEPFKGLSREQMTEILMMAQRFKQQNQEKEKQQRVEREKQRQMRSRGMGGSGALVLMRCRIGLTPQNDAICGIPEIRFCRPCITLRPFFSAFLWLLTVPFQPNWGFRRYVLLRPIFGPSSMIPKSIRFLPHD